MTMRAETRPGSLLLLLGFLGLALGAGPGCAQVGQAPRDGAAGDATGDASGVQELCGDGVVDPGEGCDDGNRLSGDGCSADCEPEGCDATTCPAGCCDASGQCQEGTQDEACGAWGGACESCPSSDRFCQDRICQELGPCSAGETRGCGDCGTRTCGAGGAWGPCEAQGACAEGAVEVTGSCGNCGLLARVCQADCTWSGLTCTDEGECEAGAVDVGAICDTCKRQERTCDAASCTWGAWSCVPHEECTPGAVEQGGACGTRCGHEERTCSTDCAWDPFECVGEGVCGAGDVQTGGACGTRCGHYEQACTASCTWDTQQCVDEGVCDPGTQGSCTTSCGTTGTRSCGATTCQWSGCTPPAEACNGADDDCDGTIDSSGCLRTLYRFYSSGLGDHMYKDTSSPDPGYVLEGSTFRVYITQVPGTVALYQQYNTSVGDHLQTNNASEGTANGYGDTQVLGYVVPGSGWQAAGLSTTQLWRYYAQSTGDHFIYPYLSDPNVPAGYVREGAVGYVWGWGP